MTSSLVFSVSPKRLEQLRDATVGLAAAHALQAALEDEILPTGRLAVDTGRLRDVPDRPPHGTRVARDVVAGDGGVPTVGRRQRGEDAHGRRLPGAVRPEQPEELARRHAERHPVERADVLVGLLEPVDDDRVHAPSLARGVGRPVEVTGLPGARQRSYVQTAFVSRKRRFSAPESSPIGGAVLTGSGAS